MAMRRRSGRGVVFVETVLFPFSVVLSCWRFPSRFVSLVASAVNFRMLSKECVNESDSSGRYSVEENYGDEEAPLRRSVHAQLCWWRLVAAALGTVTCPLGVRGVPRAVSQTNVSAFDRSCTTGAAQHTTQCTGHGQTFKGSRDWR